MLLPAQPSVAHGISRKRPSSDAPGREDTGTHCDCGTLHSNEQIRNDRCEILDIRVKKSKPEEILDGGIAGDGTTHGDSATNPTTADSTGDRSITDNDLIDGGLIDDGIGDDESKCSTESILSYQEIEPPAMELYDLLVFPTDNSIWHTYVVNPDKFPPSLWELPSVHVVGFLSNRNWVVAVASCIHQYVQHLPPEEPEGEDIFTNVLKPTTAEIAEYGLEAAKENKRSDVLKRAVEGVTCPGGPALYRYYRKIIHNDHDLLPIEWALLGYELRLSKPEVRHKLTLLSVLLELHFVQDLNSDVISQVLESKRQDRWGEYLATKESLAIAKVIENASDEMHELFLVCGLLEFAGHQTSVCYEQYGQERTIDDSCLTLGRALRCVLDPEHTSQSEENSKVTRRMRISRPLGAYDVRERLTRSGYPNTYISELCANITIFLPIGVPVPYRETLPATLVNRLKLGVVMDAIREISDIHRLYFRQLEEKENDAMLFLLYLVNNERESKATSTWMTSTEGQSMYDQTLTRIRVQAQSLEQFTLCVHTLLAYSYLLDSPEPALGPVDSCNLCDFSHLLYGDKQVNRRGVLEIVASYARKALTSLPADAAQTVIPTVRPTSVHHCDGFIERYCQHRSITEMTHDQAFRHANIGS